VDDIVVDDADGWLDGFGNRVLRIREILNPLSNRTMI